VTAHGWRRIGGRKGARTVLQESTDGRLRFNFSFVSNLIMEQIFTLEPIQYQSNKRKMRMDGLRSIRSKIKHTIRTVSLKGFAKYFFLVLLVPFRSKRSPHKVAVLPDRPQCISAHCPVSLPPALFSLYTCKLVQ
jgi:hypothetical protein